MFAYVILYRPGMFCRIADNRLAPSEPFATVPGRPPALSPAARAEVLEGLAAGESVSALARPATAPRVRPSCASGRRLRRADEVPTLATR